MYSIVFLLLVPCLAWASTMPKGEIAFRRGSDLLLREYKSNATVIADVERWMKNDYVASDPNSGYVRIVANYTEDTPYAINQAAIQGACFAAYLKQLSGDKNVRYTFYLQRAQFPNTLEVECRKGTVGNKENERIHYSLNDQWTSLALARYPDAAFLGGIPSSINRADASSSSAYSREFAAIEATEPGTLNIAIYYRFDKANLDTTYLSNAYSLHIIDSLMHLRSARSIESFRLMGYASPEGGAAYNRRLSQRRAESVKEYLLSKYPDLIQPESLVTQVGGENWEGLRRMAENDPNLPMKEQILSILENETINDEQKKSRLQRLANGTIYRNYMVPRYFPYLRSGASINMKYDDSVAEVPSIVQQKEERENSDVTPEQVEVPPAVEEKDTIEVSKQREMLSMRQVPEYKYVPLLALKTNLLMDLLTALNVEIEVPIGKKFSVAGEWMFPWWGMYDKQLYLQLLNWNVEGRYWFGDREKRPTMTGWFAGVYVGGGSYDIMLNKDKGTQGTFLTFGGVSGGFAHSIAKNLRMEYALGLSYTQHSYRKYAWDGYDYVLEAPSDQYWRDNIYFDPLKTLRAKVSLVWMINAKVKK